MLEVSLGSICRIPRRSLAASSFSFNLCLSWEIDSGCRYFPRSENERLQSLTDKQIKELADRDLHIKISEERENMLARNVSISFYFTSDIRKFSHLISGISLFRLQRLKS